MRKPLRPAHEHREVHNIKGVCERLLSCEALCRMARAIATKDWYRAEGMGGV